jgi:hypothetical protein
MPLAEIANRLDRPPGALDYWRAAVSLRCRLRRDFHEEHAMRKVLRGYAKDKSGNLILIGTMPVPFSKDKSSPATRREKRHLVKQGAKIFKKETIH